MGAHMCVRQDLPSGGHALVVGMPLLFIEGDTHLGI